MPALRVGGRAGKGRAGPALARTGGPAGHVASGGDVGRRGSALRG